MIYKGIEWFCGDLNPWRKKVEDYESSVSALKEAASMYRHPDDVTKEKALCAE